jgi:uncharacterized DUF497 family protein
MRYEWDSNKNEWLKKMRGISFEQIIFHLSEGSIWKIADHPNQRKYPGQKLYYIAVEGYIYIVPYITDKEFVFLKTIIPSRKATKIYREEQEG